MDDFFDSAEDRSAQHMKQATLDGILYRVYEGIRADGRNGHFTLQMSVPKLSHEFVINDLKDNGYEVKIERQDNVTVVLYISWE